MARSLLMQKNINQQGIAGPAGPPGPPGPGGLGSGYNFSVNTASVDSFSEEGFINLRTGGTIGSPRPADGFTGGGTGNKSIFGVQGFDGVPLGDLQSITFTWENVTGPAGPKYIPAQAVSVLTPYINLVVDFSGSLRILVLISDQLNPAISNSIGTYANNGSNILTYSWTSAQNVCIVNSPPNAVPGGVAPSVSVGPLWLENSYSFSALVAANATAIHAMSPNAELVDDFPGDGGLPAGGIVSSILLISGDSGNLTKSGKKITNFEINGSSVLPF